MVHQVIGLHGVSPGPTPPPILHSPRCLDTLHYSILKLHIFATQYIFHRNLLIGKLSSFVFICVLTMFKLLDSTMLPSFKKMVHVFDSRLESASIS